MADEKILFELDLDSHKFTTNIGNALKSIKEVGKVENLSGLISMLGSATIALGVVAGAVFAVKKALDFALEAEEIDKVNKQFEIMATNAGIAPEKLKEGLERAAGGLIDTTDLLKIASKAMVSLGDSADRLPEIMELARKATSVFGGKLEENFEHLATAVSTQQVRALRAFGIKIDQEEAYKRYARSIGAMTNELSEAGKKQAFLNAVLEKGKTSFTGIDSNAGSLLNSMKRITVVIKEFYEMFVIAFGKVFGPAIESLVSKLEKLAGSMKTAFTVDFGATELERTRASIKENEEALRHIRKEIEVLSVNKKGNFFSRVLFGTFDAIGGINLLKKSEAKIIEDLKKFKLQEEEIAKKKPEEKKEKKAEDAIDYETKLKNEAKFRSDLSKIQNEANELRLKNAQTIEDYNIAYNQKEVFAADETAAKIDEIRATYANKPIERDQLIFAEHQALSEKLKAMEEDRLEHQAEIYDRMAENSKSFSDNVTNQSKAASTRASMEWKKMGVAGGVAFKSLTNNMSDSFEAIGSGSATAAEAMRGLFLGAIADEAAARGKAMMLMGLWPPNPIAIGAGAALMMLAGYLRSMGGKSKVSTGGESAGAAMGGGAGYEPTAAEEPKLEEKEAIPKKTVTVQIMGNYFETEQTRQRMMDLIRQETDATDFKYTQVRA